jgi:hypothetical protein
VDPLMIVLRLFHIVGGALWFGSAFLFAGFVGPAAAETAPASGVVMSAVVKKRRVAEVIKWLAITTVIAGWAIWLKFALSAGVDVWVTSTYGLVLTIGGCRLGWPSHGGAGCRDGSPGRGDPAARQDRPHAAVPCGRGDGHGAVLVDDRPGGRGPHFLRSVVRRFHGTGRPFTRSTCGSVLLSTDPPEGVFSIRPAPGG